MVEIFQNIRKTYQFATPAGELAEQIEFYGETCAKKTEQFLAGQHYTIKMFPSWTPSFYINLGQPYEMTVGHVRYKINADQDVLVLRNSVVERFNRPEDYIFIVKFYPGGFESLLGINQAHFIDRVIDLRQILPGKFLQSLRQAGNFNKRMNLMNDYLLQSGLRNNKKDHYLKLVNDAIGEYTGSGMQLQTSDLAERLFVTSKTINRYFHKVVGVSPKNYFCILRTRTALTNYVTNSADFDPVNFGYYDHSHFSKDVRNFTGQLLKEGSF